MNRPLAQTSSWKKLAASAERMALPENHLKNLVKQEKRFEDFSAAGGGLFLDYSRQRIDHDVISQLCGLAEETGALQSFSEMIDGGIVNRTENRAALHTAARDFSGRPVYVGGENIMPEIRRVREEVREFAAQIHSGELTGSTGKPFKHVVIIGIGGSYLGTEFVASALAQIADKGIHLHFLSNVDIDCFGSIVSKIDPESTLWIVISKSYTTTETSANAGLADDYIRGHNLEPEDHMVAVTSRGSPGDNPSNPVCRVFHMFDFIGGRFSVTSAVGGLPLSLYLGYERFERFLKGAEEMDRHAATAPAESNLALISALTGIWNNNFLGYPAFSIIPYSTPLSMLPAHIQQLYMESTGKAVTQDGEAVGAETGMIVFGEPGTNAQHSFFQLAHQGRPFPIEFIGVIQPHHKDYGNTSKGVTNHQELWANLIAQPQALACGNPNEAHPARNFTGNRPSSVILLPDMSPENIGRLLSFYEARTVYEAFIWDINPFDQFGVELGKTMASGIRKQMAEKNRDPGRSFKSGDPISDAYLKILFSGKFGR
ncbi:MAG: glucose-6-phosphate isomerase [Desulfobacterales bacterium]|nr:glucose-6-phosphate isomerase [Desulfobacterales bacterium]